MVNTNALKAEIIKNGMSQEEVAKALGLNTRTFYYKMKMGTFWLSEAEKLISLLGIDNPTEIFFANKLS